MSCLFEFRDDLLLISVGEGGSETVCGIAQFAGLDLPVLPNASTM